MAPRADSQGGETSCGVGGVLCGTEGIGLSRLHGLGSKWDGTLRRSGGWGIVLGSAKLAE